MAKSKETDGKVNQAAERDRSNDKDAHLTEFTLVTILHS